MLNLLKLSDRAATSDALRRNRKELPNLGSSHAKLRVRAMI
jgi:hypothetical protein